MAAVVEREAKIGHSQFQNWLSASDAGQLQPIRSSDRSKVPRLVVIDHIKF